VIARENSMHSISFIYVLAVLPIACLVQSDFEQSIDSSYDFVSCNSVDTVIAEKSGEVVFSPLDFPKVGPIELLAKEENLLFIKTCGRKRRYPGQVNSNSEMPDFSREYYFVIDQSRRVRGPFGYEVKVLGPFDAETIQLQTGRDLKDLNWFSPYRNFDTTTLLIAVLFLILAVGAFAIFRIIKSKGDGTH